MMGETLLELRRPKDALKAFKMVLFLNPEDSRARQAVKKWEFLTADEYDDEVFEMKPLFKTEAPDLDEDEGDDDDQEDSFEPAKSRSEIPLAPGSLPSNREIERAVSLADAFTIRGSVDAAVNVLENAVRQFGAHPELESRLQRLSRRSQWDLPDDDEQDDELSNDVHNAHEATILAGRPRSENPSQRKRLLLERLLQRINDRRLG
jgi:hypothetical protein